MTSSTLVSKSRRNIRALFLLAFIAAFLNSLTGGIYLMTGNIKPGITKPITEVGQFALEAGLVHLFLYAGLFWQFRRLQKALAQESEKRV